MPLHVVLWLRGEQWRGHGHAAPHPPYLSTEPVEAQLAAVYMSIWPTSVALDSQIAKQWGSLCFVLSSEKEHFAYAAHLFCVRWHSVYDQRLVFIKENSAVHCNKRLWLTL